MSVQIIITADTTLDIITEIAALGEALRQGSTVPTPPPTIDTPVPNPIPPPLLVPDASSAATLSALPTPPIPPVATVSVPSVVPPVTAVVLDLDTRGWPWDTRIHSTAKTKKKNGEWKNARGKDAALVASVEAELAAAANTTDPGIPTAFLRDENNQSPAMAAPIPPVTPPAVPVAPAVPIPPVTPPAVPAVPAAQSAAELYPLVATKMSNAIQSALITPVRCAELLAEHGVNAIPELVNNAAALTAINAALDAETA